MLLLLCGSSMVAQSQTAPANITYNGGLQWVTPYANRMTPLNIAPSAGTGGTPTSYSISPALPPGLTFNTTTGVISGTRSALHVATSHTITATNAFGSTSIEFAIAVDDVPSFTGLGIGSTIPAALYSVRKLNNGYNGMAMLVRRNRDNAIKHIGFTANGDLDTVTLKNFVGTTATDSGFVQVWYNQSGYGIDSAQLNPSRQPIIVGAGRVFRGGGSANRPTVVFNLQRWLTSKANVPINGLSTFSANVVAEMTSTQFYGRILSVRSSSASSDESGIGNVSLLNIHGGFNYLGSIRNGNFAGDGPSTFTLNNQFTAMTMFSPSIGAAGFTDSIVSNMRPISRVVTTGSGGSALGTNMILAIGWSNHPNFPTNGGNPMDGRIAEVMLLPTILASSPSFNARVALASNQVNYYGITISAPSGIQYPSFQNQFAKGVPAYMQPSAGNGGAATSFSISPALPAGLTFNTATGTITGTATVTSPLTTYTVTATNSAGSLNTTFSLRVADTPNFGALGLSGISPTAMYSLRKLNPSFAGPAIHIQVRAAGSAYNSTVLKSRDIGFDANGSLDTADLKLQVGSDDAYIALWYDQSGNNRTMQMYPGGANEYPRIMSAGVMRTLRGRPTLDFNWSGRTVLYTNEVSVTKELSAHVNAVLSAETDASSNYALLSSFNTISNGDGVILRTGTAFSSSGYLLSGGTAQINGAGVSIPALNQAYIGTFKRGSTSISGYELAGGMYIGRQVGGGHPSIGGFLSELLVLPSITQNQRTDLELSQSAFYFGQDITSARSLTVCSGTALSYTATATIPGTFTWSRSAVAGISNAASSNNVTATISETLVNTTANPIVVPYTFILSGTSTGITNTFTLNVTVNPTPQINSTTTTTCSGVAFNVTPTGSIIPAGTTYTWTNPTITVSSGSITGGAAQPVGQATISQVLTSTSSSNGTARYFITPIAGSCTGTAVTLTVTVQPPVTNNTINNTTTSTCNGVTPPAFTASTPIGGTGVYTYLWQSSTDGTNFVAASGTNNTATYAPGVLTQDIWYRRIVSSGTCIANTSTAFKITVSGAPLSVGTQPIGVTVCNSATTNLIVEAAGGSGSYNYQWYSNSSNSNTGGVSLGNAPTAQTASYTVPASATAGDRFYYVVITDAICGMNTSSSAVAVTTRAALTVGTQPVSTQTICNNVSTTLTAAGAGATGNNYSYQWYSNTTNNNTGGTSLGTDAGAQTSTYTVPATTTAGSRFYYVVITDASCGVSISSNAATVITQTALTVGTQPTGKSICNNTTTTLSTAGAGATGSYSFQWYSNTTGSNVGGTSLGSASGAQTGTYTVPATTTVGTRFYYVEITDATCGVTVKSSAIPIITLATVSFTTQPIVSQTICNNTSISLTVGAVTGGSGDFGIRWHTNSSNTNTGGTPIASGNGSGTVTYTVPATTTAGDRYFYAVVTDNNCSVSFTSNPATVNTRSALTVGTQPTATQTICNNAGTTLTAAGSGASGNYTYQWFSNSSNSNTGGTSLGSGSGAQTATYSVPATATAGNRFYYVVITDVTCGVSISSNAATVTTRAALTVGTQPVLTQTICNNVSTTLTAAGAGATGNNYSYQWYSNTTNSNTNGTSLGSGAGAQTSTYTVPATTTAGSRFYYVVIADAVCGVNISSNAATVITRSALSVITQPLSQTICNNTTTITSVVAGGGSGDYGYQWYSGVTNLGSAFGGQTANRTVPATTAQGIRTYHVVITDNVCNTTINSDFANITTRAALTVGTQPQSSQTICNNISTTLTAAGAGATGTYTYQWFSNSTNSNTGGTSLGSAAGAQTATYTVPATTTAGNRFYYLVITDVTCGVSVSTDPATVTTRAPLTVGTQPLTQLSCNNVPVTITAAGAGGSLSYTYQWFSNNSLSNTGGTAISGANSASYIIPASAVESEQRYFYAVIADAVCSVSVPTQAARVTTGGVLTILSQPTSQTLCNNTALDVTALVTGGSLSYTYQWYSNTSLSNTGGSLITGATAATYTVPGTATAGDRHYYAVITENSCGQQLVTNPFTISTRPLLSVGVMPANQIICNNTTIDVQTAGAGGSGVYLYQWYSNTSLSNSGGTNLGGSQGANTNTYSVPATTVAGERYYYAEIRDASCDQLVKTNAFKITTGQVLAIQTQPQSQVVCNNSTATISVLPSGGTGLYTYQWFSNTVNSNTGGINLGSGAGAQTTNYTVPGTAVSGDRFYYVVITDASCGATIRSNATKITTGIALSVGTQPVSKIVCNNTSAVISAAGAGASLSYTYQWYSNTANSNTGGTLIAGANASSYTVPATLTAGDRFYYAVITDASCGIQVTTAVSTINTRSALVIGTHPLSQTICNNVSANLPVTVSGGSGTYSYQWYRNTVNSNSGGISLGSVSGANTAIYTIPADAVSGNRYYYAVITDTECGVSVTTNPATIFTRTALAVATQPQALQTIINNTTANITVAGVGATGVYSYQWYQSLTRTNTGGSIISGATGATYTVPATAIAGSRYFYAVITDAGCGSSITSDVAEILTTGTLTISTQPLPQTVCNNTATTLSVSAAGGSTSFTYQWYSNIISNTAGATLINGATNATYTVPASNLVNDRYFYVVVTDANLGNTITSNIAKITTRSGAPVIVSTQPAATSAICVNGTVNLQVLGIGGSSGNFVYQWYSNTTASNTGGTVIPGQTGTSFSTSLNSLDTRYYYATVADPTCGVGVPSNVATVNVRAIPTASVTPQQQTVCLNAGALTADATVTGGAGSVSYQWYSNSTNSTVGGTSLGTDNGARTLSFTPSASSQGTMYYYMEASFSGNGCGVAKSNTHQVTVNQVALPSDIVITTPNLNLCRGLSTSLKASLSATSTIQDPVFNWYADANFTILLGTGTDFVTPVLNATTTYYVKVSGSNACENLPGNGQSQTITLTEQAPEVILPANLTVCTGVNTSQVVFSSAVSGTTYTWSNNNTAIGLAASGNGNIPSFFTANSDLTNRVAGISVTPFANGCVGVTKTFTITVVPNALVNDTSFIVCSGMPVNYTPVNVPSGKKYTWVISSAPASITGASDNNIPASSFSQTLSSTSTIPVNVVYAVTPDGCSDRTFAVTITVNPVPQINNQSLTSAICNGAGFTTSNFAGVVPEGTLYTWTTPTSNPLGAVTGGNSQSIKQSVVNENNLFHSRSDIANALYLITPYSSAVFGGCVGQPFTLTVPVNPKPVLVTTNAGSICNRTAAVYTPSSLTAGVAYTWRRLVQPNISNEAASGVNGFSEVLHNTAAFPVLVDYEYTLTANGCSNTQIVQVLVNPDPLLSSSTSLSVCSGALLNYTPSSLTTGTSFAWSRAVVAGIKNLSNTGTSDIFEALVNTTNDPVVVTYRFTLTANGCTHNEDVQVTVNPIPGVADIAQQAVCSGAPVQVNFTGSQVTGTVYNWTNMNSNIGLASSGTGNILFTTANTSNQLQTASISVVPVANGCSGPAKNFNILVQPPLTLSSSTTPSAICTNTAFVYTPESNALNVSFSWSRAFVNGISNGAATGNGIIRETLINNTSIPVKVTYEIAITANGCTSTQLISVTVNPTPAVSNITDKVVCNGSSVEVSLTGSSVAGTIYNWTNTNSNIGLASSGTGNILFTATNISTKVLTGSLSVTPVANGCSGPAKSFTIQVQPTLVLTSSTAPLPICTNAEFIYVPESNTENVSFSWSRASVNGISNGAATGTGTIRETLINDSNVPVKVTYEITLTANGCTSTQLISVTVIPMPAMNDIATNTVCNGATVEINFAGTSVAGTVYNWTNSNSNIGLPSSGTGNILFTATNLSTQLLTGSLSVVPVVNGCSGVAKTFNIQVQPTLSLSSSATPPAICSNTVFSYQPQSITAGVSFSWSRAVVNGISNTAASGTGKIEETLVNNTNTAIQVPYEITITSANGCSAKKTVIVTVNPTPSVANVTNKIFCNNSVAVVNFSGSSVSNTNYRWTNDNTDLGILSEGINDLFFVATNTTNKPIVSNLVVTPESGVCKGAPVKFTITINPPLKLTTATSLPAVCSNQLLTYEPLVEGNSNAVISWTRPSVFGISNRAASGTGLISERLVNTTSLPVLVTYVITIASEGCSSTENVSVLINPAINITNAGSGFTVCSKEAFLFSPVLSVSGTQLTWTREAVPGISNAAATGTGDIAEVLVNTASVPVDVLYKYTISQSSACVSDQFVKVTVQPQPQLISGKIKEVCSNVSVGYSPESNLTGTNFTWSRPAITGIANSASGGIGIIGESLVNRTSQPIVVTYLINMNNANACSNTDSIKVTVNPSPTVNIMTDQLVCKDARTQAIQFTGIHPNTIFNWTNTETGIGLAASGTGNIPSFLATNNSAVPLSATIDVVPELNGCKGASTSVIRLTVNPGISSQFIEAAPLAACPNELVGPLLASYPNGGDGVNYAFQWMVSTDRLNYTPITTSGANNRRFFAQAQTKDTWYKMMVSSGGCTAYTDSVKVRMGVAPVVTVSNKDNYTISIGNATQLVAEGATSYIWTPRLYISDAFIANPMVSPLTDNFRYVVTGMNSDGCSDTASVIIKVTEGYSIAPNNILTPNNDGYNDLWVIKNIQYYSTHRIAIYNANGSLVKTPWVNNYVSWDGKNDAGVTVPAGTYYYVIDLGSGKALIKGSLTIIY